MLKNNFIEEELALEKEWVAAKKAEKKAVERRRAAEDKLVALLGVDVDAEGTETHENDTFSTKIVKRFNRKVDSKAVQDIAAEEGTTDYLSTLFRWKPEISAGAWKNASDNITKPLLAAITTTPGRPSFNISKKD